MRDEMIELARDNGDAENAELDPIALSIDAPTMFGDSNEFAVRSE